MLKDSMKQTEAFHTFVGTQPLPTAARDVARMAWNAACLWQRNQDVQIVDVVDPFEKDALTYAILTQYTLKLEDAQSEHA